MHEESMRIRRPEDDLQIPPDPNRILPGAVESLADRRGRFTTPQILEPKKDRVFVRVDEEVSSYGVLKLAETTTEAPLKGVVVRVGTGRMLQDGTPVPVDLKIGDRVTFNRNAGAKVHASEMKILGARNKELFYLLREDEVTAVVRAATEDELALQKQVDEVSQRMAEQSEALADAAAETIFGETDDSDLDVAAGEEDDDDEDDEDDDSDLDEKDED